MSLTVDNPVWDLVWTFCYPASAHRRRAYLCVCWGLGVVRSQGTALGNPTRLQFPCRMYFSVDRSVWDLVWTFCYPASAHRCRAYLCVCWGLGVVRSQGTALGNPTRHVATTIPLSNVFLG